MVWRFTDDVEEFLAAAGDFLRERPVENTVLITVADSVRRLRTRTAHFGWAPDGAFIHTPPFPLQMSAMPAETAVALADELDAAATTHIGGPDAAADAFTARWQRRTGTSAQVVGRMRLFRLAGLVSPSPSPPGTARVAGTADRELLVDWTSDFFREVGEAADVVEFVDERIEYGGQMFWEVNGSPVAMAAVTRPEAGMVRIQAVYTPEAHRSHGYAAAVTAALSQAALDSGATEVVLFTDVDNATANALYPRIGYVPLADRTTMEFNP